MSACLAVVAFVFLVAAALAQIAIPWLTGRAIDSVALGGTLRDNKEFTRSIELLTGMSVACGICSGLRGCLFQLAEARLGFRLRKQVFGAVLHREMKFFDETDTVRLVFWLPCLKLASQDTHVVAWPQGQITSRLTSDVTKVTDSITLNLNVFLRSLVTAVGIIVFMATLKYTSHLNQKESPGLLTTRDIAAGS